MVNLSSCPRMQVEIKRQQESGQGMILYWPHHLVITMLHTTVTGRSSLSLR